MKNKIVLGLTTVLLIMLMVRFGQSQTNNQSLTPYMQILADKDSTCQLPLTSIKTKVNVSSVIASVNMEQVYCNNGDRPLEAIYVFPASDKAAVHLMKMHVGDRTIVAEIRKIEEAKQVYQKAKREGKRASLLDQERPNIFTMHVANILPGDEVRIELEYTETLIPDDGEYSFVYPTVVGPRYTGESRGGSDPGNGIPYLRSGVDPNYLFDMDLDLMMGVPIQSIYSHSHKIDIDHINLGYARINLDENEYKKGNKDFILNYQLKGNNIESGLLLYEGEKEKYFLMTVQPPTRVKPGNMPAREFVFIVDVSGSMSGFPLEVSKSLMHNVLVNLRPQDRFNILLFASCNKAFAPHPVPATAEEIEKALTFVNQQEGGGGTNILQALKKAMALPKNILGLSRSMVILSDGYISVEREVFDLIRDNNNESNFFVFGIGSSVNQYLINGIAHVGNSVPLIATTLEDACAQTEKFRRYISTPVLTDVQIDWGGFEVYDLVPSSISDLMAERPIVISGKYKGDSEGKIKLHGTTGSKKYKWSYDLSNSQPEEVNQGLKYLWARRKIGMLDDYASSHLDKNEEQFICDLALKYNLVSRFTSFVAVDEIIEGDGNMKTIYQPLVLPEGVSDLAIGPASYGVGADLQISNRGKNGGLRQVKFTISSHLLSLIDLKFVSWEIKSFLSQIESRYNLKGMNKVIFNLEIDGDGNISLKDQQNREYSDLVRSIIKELLTFTINHKVTHSFDLTVSLRGIGKS